ncbi:MAG TPA: FG-GAP-like repeat-containing protein [Saprospiraceae bacterium]|nr:FG-GAP-like repeat-containing protein [Saprospiraceae bacterium]
MNKVLLFFTLLLLSTNMFSQNISFESSKILFEHPRPANTGLNYPFIPLDYNSDGLTDFIGATFNDQFIYKGIENNSFEQIDIYQGFAHNPLKVMDFDKDGFEDIIMERYINIYKSVDSFLFFNPDINFQETIIEVADFNNDGLNDILTQKELTFENDQLIIHYNQGNNVFMAEVIYNKYDYADVALGDIDNDGDIDIAVILSFEDIPIVILYNQNSLFEDREVAQRFDIGRTTIKLHDLDDDDDLDIIVSGSFDDIFILENVNNFTNEDNVVTVRQSNIEYFNVADINNDDKLDIMMLSSDFLGFNISYMEGEGGFDFKLPEEIETFSKLDFFGYPNYNYVVNNLSLYDFDSDGFLDIIYTDGFGLPNQIKWLKNASATSSLSHDSAALKSISIFPNPSQDYLEIKSSYNINNLNFEILSICGESILSHQLIDSKIDISDLKEGIYFIKFGELNLVERFAKI